jgi:putrescine transport system permease protein
MKPDSGTLGGVGARLVVWIPYVWLVVFFLVPFLIVLKISLSQTAIALPPYVPVLDLDRGWNGIRDFIGGIGLDNYATLFSDQIYGLSYLKSLKIAAVSTAILLAIGYPLAYAMARAPRRAQSVLVVLVILPFWTSFLIRVYAWINILQTDGLFNRVLDALHVIELINRVRAVLDLELIEQPVAWLASDTAIYIGIVYSYLPFMVLPLYATLEKMDFALLEAAADLGARPASAFWRVTVPLSLPGVAAGALLCFIPITGEFVIPDLLGGSDSLMIGQTLWTEFFSNKDWPVASAIAVVLLVLLVGPILVYQHLQMKTVQARA